MRSIRERFSRLFGGNREREELYEEMEDLLVEADMGPITATTIVDEFRQAGRGAGAGRDEMIESLRDIIAEHLVSTTIDVDPDTVNVFLVLGVNGVGKTTTIAKLAGLYRREYDVPVYLAAADTFRAAAIDQLSIHGDRLGIRTYRQEPGSDPGAVVFDAVTSVLTEGRGLIFADTAGRMHNKANLVRELQKIDKVIGGKRIGGVYKKLLVIDATTGLNGYRQAEVFNEAIGVDAVILSKFDSAAKGGSIISICKELKLPFAFVGTGEGYEDLRRFDSEHFLEQLFGETD
jgi:fused signal recognition particle receptor